MTLDFLTGSYRLYKAQTASILSWLTETATKGNVRLPRRRSIESSTSPVTGPTYLIDVNNIVPFARLVTETSAQTKSAQTPPMKVLEDLRQTITSRRRFTDWYHGQSVNDAALEQSDKSHRHLNSVPEGLLDVLTSSIEEGEETVSNKRARDSQSALGITKTSENRFDILELESLALNFQENDLDSALQTVQLPRSISHKARTETSYEFQDPRQDTQFYPR